MNEYVFEIKVNFNSAITADTPEEAMEYVKSMFEEKYGIVLNDEEIELVGEVVMNESNVQ